MNRVAPTRFTIQSLFFTENEKIIGYRENSGALDNVHWGQRKLLLGEIVFLTKYITPGTVMVVAGGAHGDHYRIIEELFPDLVQIRLYDPADFKVKETEKIKIFNQLFEDEDAEKLSKEENILFLSDIRTVDEGAEGPTEENIDSDMQLQMRWVEMIRPRAAMLKMRLPFYIKNGVKKPKFKEYEYLKGLIFKQIWNKPKSTEGRLIVERPPNGGDYQKVKTKTLENQDIYYYHNHIVRGVRKFYTDFSTVGVGFDENLDDSFDSIAESAIILQYLIKLGSPKKLYPTRENIVRLSNYFSEEIAASDKRGGIMTLRKKRKNARH